jgi:uncharacterized protein YpbB
LSELNSGFYKQMHLLNKSYALINSCINDEELTNNRIENLDPALVVSDKLETGEVKEIKSAKKKSSAVKEKKNTKEESYLLYKKGLSISEIAEARGYVVTTIESHLAYYVSLGMLDVNEFVTIEKRSAIIEESKKQDSPNLTPIKHALGDSFSFSEIKFALAYYQTAKLAATAS